MSPEEQTTPLDCLASCSREQCHEKGQISVFFFTPTLAFNSNASVWCDGRKSCGLRVPTCWQRYPIPRILKEPEGCEFSIFRYTLVPTRLDMVLLSSSGVFRWKWFAMVHLNLTKMANGALEECTVEHVDGWAKHRWGLRNVVESSRKSYWFFWSK